MKDITISVPCEVNDTVWVITTICDCCDEDEDHCRAYCKKPKGFTTLQAAKIEELIITGGGFCVATGVLSNGKRHFYKQDFGKIAFLSREEALKALYKNFGKIHRDSEALRTSDSKGVWYYDGVNGNYKCILCDHPATYSDEEGYHALTAFCTHCGKPMHNPCVCVEVTNKHEDLPF